MEKIQSAIQKARAARATATPAVPEPAVAPAIGATGPVGSDPAAAWAALPSFAVDAARLQKGRIVAFAGGKETVGFDMLRTKVLQQMRIHNWHRVAITSPTPYCGKSTIALNLAFSMARQKELRIVLAELDLRRPALSRMLGLKARGSFSQVLEGRSDFANVAQRYGEGLAIATNEGPVRNPAELLHGGPVAGALAAVEAHYKPDLILFDMPPMLVSDDVMAFMGQVDAVLLVAAAETTTIKEIDACERELASQTNVMGVVLNKCRYMGSEYGYDYYG